MAQCTKKDGKSSVIKNMRMYHHFKGSNGWMMMEDFKGHLKINKNVTTI